MAYINPYYGTQFMNYGQQNQQIQNGGFISVRSENEARMWAVAPGNSVTFRNENAPYIYTKTMGFSQLDQPIFEKYRLVKESPIQEVPQEVTGQPQNDFVTKQEIEDVRSAIEALRTDLDALRAEVGIGGEFDV